MNNKVNKVNLIYAAKIGLKIRQINIKARKIDGSILKTFDIVPDHFQVENKLKIINAFYKTFLLTNIRIKIFLKIFFLFIRNIKIKFHKKRLF